MKKCVVIGIDPDVEKCGVGIVWPDGRVEVRALTFGQLVSYLNNSRDLCAELYVEAGWMNLKTTWHARPGDSKAVAAKKGHSVGRNHQIGHDIVELARVYGYDVHEVRPLLKCWKGPDGKITAAELEHVVGSLPGRTNQEMRDALLLAWVHADRPVRVSVR